MAQKNELNSNQRLTGESCPLCSAQLVENTMADCIFCGECHYVKKDGPIGLLAKSVMGTKSK